MGRRENASNLLSLKLPGAEIRALARVTHETPDAVCFFYHTSSRVNKQKRSRRHLFVFQTCRRRPCPNSSSRLVALGRISRGTYFLDSGGTSSGNVRLVGKATPDFLTRQSLATASANALSCYRFAAMGHERLEGSSCGWWDGFGYVDISRGRWLRHALPCLLNHV